MPKTYSRARNGYGEHPTSLGKSLLSWQNSSDAWVKAVTTGIFSHLKVSILHRIIFEAGRNARLGPCDEKIFDYYKQIIECYESVLFLYGSNKDLLMTSSNGKNTKKILYGIFDVLTSRTRQFEDTATNRSNNPISTEKKEIISKGLMLFLKEYDAISNDYYKNNYQNSLQKARRVFFNNFTLKEALEFFGGILEDICQFSEAHLYKAYISCLNHSLDGLNDDVRRSITFFYYELLIKEEEFLSGIVKIQVAALEGALEKEPTDPKTNEFVFLILTNLREGYQKIKGQLKEISDAWKEAKGDNPSSSEKIHQEEDFALILKEILHRDRLFSTPIFEEYRNIWNKRKMNFTDKLKDELYSRVKKELKQYSVGRTVYELQKIIAEQLLMTQDLCRCYEEIIAFFNLNKDILNTSGHWDIISGIHETLEIKIESILENKQSYSQEGQRLIEEYKNKLKNPDYDFLEIAVISFLQQNYKEYNGKNVTGFIEQACNAAMKSEEMSSVIESADKAQANIKSIFLKLSERFKKEHLLYELSTFEEIIIYSVSRLRESKEEDTDEAKNAVETYVKRIDLSSDQIEIILRKHNIYLIKPSPHDLFNAKEHEVLVAEQNKDFQKGEIIKLMNSGYKHSDRVLLRANVIAAK